MTTRLRWMALAVTLATAPAYAEMFIYPTKGQSPERQKKDEGQCYVWAKDQSGFDPANPPAAPAVVNQPVTQGGVVRGGARGAAIGAVGGAIGGNAGKGAAVGAATGAMVGGMRRADAYRQQTAYNSQVQAQHQSQIDAGHASYNRAFAACIEGRGYTVK